jgi:hypothetical protein
MPGSLTEGRRSDVEPRFALIERVHGLDRNGHADPGTRTRLEPMQAARLPADRAIVPAPEEADQP